MCTLERRERSPGTIPMVIPFPHSRLSIRKYCCSCCCNCSPIREDVEVSQRPTQLILERRKEEAEHEAEVDGAEALVLGVLQGVRNHVV